MDRRGTISAGERAELQRLQDEHGTIHVGDPSARYYRFGDDATKPRH